MNTLPLSQFIFPDPIEADPDGHGLICIGADLSPSTLYEAYTHGLFPWFNED
ncbi:leucyl/phenylalanyl-tRNA--protein transferase, partial [Acinetobacter sp. A11]